MKIKTVIDNRWLFFELKFRKPNEYQWLTLGFTVCFRRPPK